MFPKSLIVLTFSGWQSGYAAACKAVDAGSIPTPASKYYRPDSVAGGRFKTLPHPRLIGDAAADQTENTSLIFGRFGKVGQDL